LTTGDKELYIKAGEFQNKWIQQLKEHIAEEVEEYRVHRCRCGETLEKDCDALQDAIDIITRQK
jgi:CDGSH-type Zn-finger protein